MVTNTLAYCQYTEKERICSAINCTLGAYLIHWNYHSDKYSSLFNSSLNHENMLECLYLMIIYIKRAYFRGWNNDSDKYSSLLSSTVNELAKECLCLAIVCTLGAYPRGWNKYSSLLCKTVSQVEKEIKLMKPWQTCPCQPCFVRVGSREHGASREEQRRHWYSHCLKHETGRFKIL